MCANAGRAPSGQRRVPGRCHFILNDTTKRRSGAVEFKVVRKLHRAIYNVLKYDKKNRTIPAAACRAPYRGREIVRIFV